VGAAVQALAMKRAYRVAGVAGRRRRRIGRRLTAVRWMARRQHTAACQAPSPLQRRSIDAPLATGARAIDARLRSARPRVGIFAMAGGGKSTLLACSLARRAPTST